MSLTFIPADAMFSMACATSEAEKTELAPNSTARCFNWSNCPPVAPEIALTRFICCSKFPNVVIAATPMPTRGVVTAPVKVEPRLTAPVPKAVSLLPKLVIAEPIRLKMLISVAKLCKRPCNSLILAAVSIIAVRAPSSWLFSFSVALATSPMLDFKALYFSVCLTSNA